MKNKNKICSFVAVLFFVGVFFAINIKNVNAQTSYRECIDVYEGTEADCKGYPGDPEVYTGAGSPNYGGDVYTWGNDDAFDPTTGGGSVAPNPEVYGQQCGEATPFTCNSGCCSCNDYCSENGLTDAQCACSDSSIGGGGYDNTGKAGSVCTSNWYGDSCSTGFTCENGTCVQSWAGKNLGLGDSNNTQNLTKTQEELAKEKADADRAANLANTATAAQNNAVQRVNAANAEVANCGNVAACEAARRAADEANEALVAANARAEAAILEAQRANDAYYGNSGSGGGAPNVSYQFCANGIMATICNEGGGRPIGGSNTRSNSATRFGTYGPGGNIQPKCGMNFRDIGGVCFPMSTGLSDASITDILMSLFNWLMGMFTTLAIVAFIISGIQYVTAAGDDGMMETAKKNAKYAIIGIVVGLSGFVMVNAIAAALSGQSYLF